MRETSNQRIFLRLIQVGLFLAAGSLLGFLLGLAYASHLYGASHVVAQLHAWFGADTFSQGPLPTAGENAVDSSMIVNTTVAMIPQLGACFGFALALTAMIGHLVMKAFIDLVKANLKSK